MADFGGMSKIDNEGEAATDSGVPLSLKEKIASSMWLDRWFWILLPAMFIFGMVNWMLTHVESPTQYVNPYTTGFSLAFMAGMLTATVCAWIISLMHCIKNTRRNWTLGLLLFPPAAFAYLALV